MQRIWAVSRRRSIPAATWVLIALGVLHSLVTAVLVVDGSWHLAIGLIVAPPAVVFLYKYPFLAVLVWLTLAQFFVITPTSSGRMVFWVLHRAMPPMTIGLVLLSHALGQNRRPLPRLGIAEVVMAGYVIVSLVSIVLLNETPLATTYRFYDRVFSPMCLYLLVRLSAPTKTDLQRLVVAAFVVTLTQSLIGVLSWVAPQILPSDWLGKVAERTIGSLVNPSTYTTTLVFGGLLVLHSAFNRRSDSIRTAYLCCFVLGMACVFLSFSRASWLGGLLAVLGLIYLYPKAMGRLSVIAAPALIVIGSAGVISMHVSYASERLNSENTALDRLPAYYAAYLMFQEKPYFGWGYANFEVHDRRFQGSVLGLPNDGKDHANHSAYLTLIAEQGLIGTVLFLWPLVWWIMLTLKHLPKLPPDGFTSRKLVIVLWLTILNIFVVNNFTPAWVAFGWGVWWLSLGLIAYLVSERPAVPSPDSARPHWRAGVVHVRTG